MTILVRPMRVDDLDSALAMFADVAAEGRWIGTEAGFDRAARRQQWLAGLSDPGSLSLVVTEGASDPPIGTGHLHLAPYGVAELGMALSAPARGRGIGGVLLDALIEAARGLGAHKASLQVWPHNEPALRLYRSRGFVVEGRLRAHYRRADGQLWDSVLMGLKLGSGDVDGPHTGDGIGLPDAASLPRTLEMRGAD